MPAKNILRAAVSALVLAAAPPAFSQWEGTDINPTSLSLVYTDSLHDWLLVAVQGQPMTINDSAYLPMLRYNGLAWDTLGLFGHYVRTAVVYHDTLFVGGVFDYVRNSTASNIAYYANGAWHPYGTFTNQIDHGLVQRLRVVDDTLYAVGQFEYADGQFCQGLAKRVGAHWEPVQGWPDLALNADPWLMDIIRYQGKLVVAGNFSSQDMTLKDMLQYNGTAWVPVCTGCLMGGAENPAVLAIYQDDLYVGGGFFYATGNAGQGIMRWNGQQWSSLRPPGEGLQNINYSDQYSPSIMDLQVHVSIIGNGGGSSGAGRRGGYRAVRGFGWNVDRIVHLSWFHRFFLGTPREKEQHQAQEQCTWPKKSIRSTLHGLPKVRKWSGKNKSVSSMNKLISLGGSW